jgi:hypothetical protein
VEFSREVSLPCSVVGDAAREGRDWASRAFESLCLGPRPEMSPMTRPQARRAAMQVARRHSLAVDPADPAVLETLASVLHEAAEHGWADLLRQSL